MKVMPLANSAATTKAVINLCRAVNHLRKESRNPISRKTKESSIQRSGSPAHPDNFALASRTASIWKQRSGELGDVIAQNTANCTEGTIQSTSQAAHSGCGRECDQGQN